jgi:uncharacterized protein RhaS with RHS repeats
MGARVYEPYTGTFTQPDPIQGGGANAYAYTNGDPVNELDLTGDYEFLADAQGGVILPGGDDSGPATAPTPAGETIYRTGSQTDTQLCKKLSQYSACGAGERRVERGKDAGRVQWQSHCPDRGRSIRDDPPPPDVRGGY